MDRGLDVTGDLEYVTSERGHDWSDLWLMHIFFAIAIGLGLTLALTSLPMPGMWWHIARWAFYLPILVVGAKHGSFAGLFAGVTASLLCAVVAASRGMWDVYWPSILAPDFAVVGLLGGFPRMWPRFRKLYSTGEADLWPSLSRISEAEITIDLSPPLASIESAARLLGEGDTPAEMRKELAGIIVKECKHLSGSITGLLQQRREGTPPQSVEADIIPIIGSAFRQAEFVLSGRGIVLREEIAPGVPPIQCSPDQLRNLFVSLIVNAAQSATSGTEVVLNAHLGYDGVVLEVSSQGSFVRRAANRLFGPRSLTSGVGLALAHDIVLRHNGRITCKTKSGKGLAFSVWLPLRRNDTNGGWQGAGSRGR